MADLSVEKIQKLIDSGRALQREQDQLAGALEEKEKALADVEKSIREDLGIEPDQLAAEIDRLEVELHNEAVAVGLIEGEKRDVPKQAATEVDLDAEPIVEKRAASETGSEEKVEAPDDDGLVDFPPSEEEMAALDAPAESPDLDDMFGDI